MSKVVSYMRLSITVLRAELHQSYDYWSESDCYVTLRIPTSSARLHRTQTVPNNNNPEWNETFHFRLHSHVKNVLEIQVFDDDSLLFMGDDLCAVILFDLSNLKLAKKQTKEFLINEQTNDKLWIEFEVVESDECPETYPSNGVLVVPPLSILDITPKNTGTAIKNLILKLKGAYKEEYALTTGLMDSLRYYINKDLETELTVTGDNTVLPVSLSHNSLRPVSVKQEIKVPLGKYVVDLELKTERSTEQDLAVRLDFDVPTEEKQFLQKRKAVVGPALQRLLGLRTSPQPDKVPLVGVVCSGGGARAMTGTFGSLKALQALGILDTISYITGVSGSTWAMSTLYEISDWSQSDMGVVTDQLKTEMIKRYQDILSTEQLRYYREEMDQREKEGAPVTYIDMWGLAIEHLIHGKKWGSTLSDQKRAVCEGQNPMPIYTAVNMKSSLRGNITDTEWCEFSPYEVGFPKYGAFVPTEHFGSEHFLGRQVRNVPETRMPFLIGLWSSAMSVSLSDVWHYVTGSKPVWNKGDVTNTETDNRLSTLDTLVIKPRTSMTEMISNFFTSRPISSLIYNFMRGMTLHWDYNKRSGFVAEHDTHPDAFPNQMTPADATLNLVDAGFACNTGFPPVLRPHRRMDLVVSLNYSWDLDQFEVLKKTQQQCANHRIPFPRIDFDHVENEPMKEVYVFEDEENPRAPIVIHFPMVNLTFREFKAPGVRRKGEDELKQGDLDVSTDSSPYVTTYLAYQPEDFQKLMDLTYYNVLNNREALLSALHRVLEKGRVGIHEDEHKDHTCH